MELVALAVVIALSVGLALIASRLAMDALISVMTHQRAAHAIAEPATTRVPATTGRAQLRSTEFFR